MARHEMSAKSGRLSPNRGEGVHSPLILLESAFVGKCLELRPIQLLDFDDFLDRQLWRRVIGFQSLDSLNSNFLDKSRPVFGYVARLVAVAVKPALAVAVVLDEAQRLIRLVVACCPLASRAAAGYAAFALRVALPDVRIECCLGELELIAAILEVELPPHPRGFLLRLFLSIAPRQLHRAFSPANPLCRGILRGELPLTDLALLHARMHRASPLA